MCIYFFISAAIHSLSLIYSPALISEPRWTFSCRLCVFFVFFFGIFRGHFSSSSRFPPLNFNHSLSLHVCPFLLFVLRKLFTGRVNVSEWKWTTTFEGSSKGRERERVISGVVRPSETLQVKLKWRVIQFCRRWKWLLFQTTGVFVKIRSEKQKCWSRFINRLFSYTKDF